VLVFYKFVSDIYIPARSCSVIDMGVMVPCDKILDTAVEVKADIIGKCCLNRLLRSRIVLMVVCCNAV